MDEDEHSGVARNVFGCGDGAMVGYRWRENAYTMTYVQSRYTLLMAYHLNIASVLW